MSKLAKIKYYVYPEKKLVVGKASRDRSYGIADELYDKIPGSLIDIFGSIPCRIKDIGDFADDYFKAKAIARDTDVFDEKVGKSIVAKKLNYKYHRSMMKRCQVLIRQFKTILEMLNRIESEHHCEMVKCDEELKKYE